MNKLPLVQFHHLNPKLKKNTWYRLRDLANIEKIKQILKKERCKALCANCHGLTSDKILKKYRHEILSKYLLDPE